MRVWVPLSLFIAWALLALISPSLPLVPNEIDLHNILTQPDGAVWFGYDELGRSISDRLLVGARTSFFVAVSVVLLTLAVGSVLGTVGAYWGGWADHILVRVIDVFLAFPGILLAIALAGVLGPGLNNVIIALAAVGWVGYARLARAQVLALKNSDQVVAARALGAKSTRIIRSHLIPMISAPLIVEASFGFAGVVIAEAGLSFLGLGVQPPTASWGSMIREGTDYMLVAPHVVIAPGMALMTVVLAVNLLGDWLRDWLDVKSKVERE
jgi:peptide/nickel transport system permease protein